jgi:hypothetical protein
MHHHRQANDLGAAMKVFEWIKFRHPGTLQTRPARLKQNPSDTAPAPLRLSLAHSAMRAYGQSYACPIDVLSPRCLVQF